MFMKRLKIIIVATAVLLTSIYIQVTAMQIDENDPTIPVIRPMESPLWLRLRNQIRDTLGVCDGTCQEDLVELTGELSYDGSYFFVNNVEVHFGPTWFITTNSLDDFDEDGISETIFEELEDLIGTIVSFEGYYQSDNWFSVFTINGINYRDVGRPIWSGGNGNGNGPNGP